MNILDARILLKRSTTAGVTPTIPASATHTDGSWVNTDIYSGEAFLNTVDQRIFVRTGANIKEIQFQNYWVGQSFGGGVIFHTYRDSNNIEHGLIVSTTNQSTSSAYSNIDTNGAFAASRWNGQANTNALKAQTGATSGAWKVCDDYSSGGFSDWYLPSISELQLLWNNRYNVYKNWNNISQDLFIDNYWSSTEYDDDMASSFNFGSGLIDVNTLKNTSLYVRAIRQF
jgi:hypothetical protein